MSSHFTPHSHKSVGSFLSPLLYEILSIFSCPRPCTRPLLGAPWREVQTAEARGEAQSYFGKGGRRYDKGETSNKKERCVSQDLWAYSPPAGGGSIYPWAQNISGETRVLKLIRGVAKIRQASGKVQETAEFQKDLWRTSTTGLIPGGGGGGGGRPAEATGEREGRGGKRTCVKCRL